MADASSGYRAGLGRRQPTPGLISSLRGTAESPLFIFFSISNLCCWTPPCDVPCILAPPDLADERFVLLGLGLQPLHEELVQPVGRVQWNPVAGVVDLLVAPGPFHKAS